MVAKTQTMGGSVSEYHKSRGMTVCDPAPHQPRAIGHLLTRPVGRSPNEVRHSFTNFTHPADEAAPRRRQDRMALGRRPAANAVAFYNKRRTWELWMNKGKGVIRLTRLS